MTVKEVKETYEGKFADIEVYVPISTGEFYPDHFHTDNCTGTDDYSESAEVGLVELMDEDEYNSSLLANCDVAADFGDWYGDKNAKVLCVMLK